MDRKEELTDVLKQITEKSDGETDTGVVCGQEIS